MSTAENQHGLAALEEIAGHPFLQDLCKDHLEALASCAMRIRFAAGDLIFREGDPANRFYLLIEGKVALEAQNERGRIAIQTIGAGDVLAFPGNVNHSYQNLDARRGARGVSAVILAKAGV